MDFRKISIVFAVACCMLPFMSTHPLQSIDLSYSEELDFLNRDTRQIGFLSRVANSTRNVVKYIREYGSARISNNTTPEPQSTIGKRVVPYLQHVTLSNIREAVTALVNSDAAPVVATFFKNLDRDTLQLFNSQDRTSPPLLIPTKKPTPAATTASSKSRNSTTAKPGQLIATTVASAAQSSTKQTVLNGGSGIRKNINNSESEKIKVKAVENEDDEDDSSEDD